MSRYDLSVKAFVAAIKSPNFEEIRHGGHTYAESKVRLFASN